MSEKIMSFENFTEEWETNKNLRFWLNNKPKSGVVFYHEDSLFVHECAAVEFAKQFHKEEIDSLKSQLKEKDEQINLFHTHTALKVKEYVESKNYYDLPEKFHEEIDDFLNWYKKERDDQIKEMRLELKQKDAEIEKKDTLLKEAIEITKRNKDRPSCNDFLKKMEQK